MNSTTLWTDDELKRAVKAYFKMLKYEKNKTPYVKSEINRQLQAELPNRNHKSIEYRWQNISAVLEEHGYNFISGYKPARNVGSSVKERIWKIIKDLKLI
jgi:5-methylcytosine-specific restriction protein A